MVSALVEKRGDKHASLFLVRNIRIRVINASGGEITKFFGVLALLENCPAKEEISAHADCFANNTIDFQEGDISAVQ
jgi:hypothetical protein